MIFALIAAGLNITGGILGGIGRRRELGEAAELRKTEAQLAQIAAMDAFRRGSIEAGMVRRETANILSQQTLLAGASGLDIQGSSAITGAEAMTRFFGELDAATVEENAIREAMGLLDQSNVLLRQARSLRRQRDWAIPMGILSGLSHGASAIAGAL